MPAAYAAPFRTIRASQSGSQNCRKLAGSLSPARRAAPLFFAGCVVLRGGVNNVSPSESRKYRSLQACLALLAVKVVDHLLKRANGLLDDCYLPQFVISDLATVLEPQRSFRAGAPLVAQVAVHGRAGTAFPASRFISANLIEKLLKLP